MALYKLESKEELFRIGLVLISMLALFFIPLPAQAGTTGNLQGKVVDAKNGAALPGANVYLKGTALGSATDLDGNYRILNVPPGPYDLVVSFIGYNIQKISIRIEPEQTLTQDVKMTFTSIQLAEVTISAQREGQVGAINRQLTADALMNAVAADRIQELPDANVAESIGRIPGVSVSRDAGEANKIIIRGLEPKLNAVMVNGVRIPATSAENRSVDLSMISSDLLESIEVFKAPTPDMDAEAVGGIVNLKVKKAPERQKMLLRINGGANPLNQDYGDYKAVGEFSRRFFDKKMGLVIGGNLERFNRGSERFGASYDIAGLRDPVTGIVPVKGISMNIRNAEEIRRRYGLNVTFDYAYAAGVVWLSNFYSKTSRNPFSIQKNYVPKDDNIVYNVSNSEIDLQGMSSSLNGEHHLLGMDVDWVLSRYHAQTNNDYQFDMEYVEDGNPYKSTLVDADINTWAAAAKNDLDVIYLGNAYFRPDTTLQTDHAANLNIKIPFGIGKKLSGFLKFGGKFTETDRERNSFAEGQHFYYMGGSYVSNARALYPGNLELNSKGRISVRNFITSATDLKKIVNGDYELFPLFNKEKLNTWYDAQQSTFRFDRGSLSDQYDLIERVSAGYVMAKLNYGQFLTVIPGIRYEHSDNNYNAVWSTVNEVYGAQGIAKDANSSQNYERWFPHLHLKVKPLSWFDVRLSANKTLARPDFYWVAPWTRMQPGTTRIDRGNPALKPSISWNYDLSTSFYSNTLGLFTVGGFYKQMQDIFYRKLSRVVDAKEIAFLSIPGGNSGWEMNTFVNSDQAKVWGFEVDLQTQLGLVTFLPQFLKGVVFNANYAHIWSETYFPFNKYQQKYDYSSWPPKVTIEYTEWERKGTMPGQAKDIFNVSLGYDYKGLSTRLSILYQGASRSSVGQIAEQDTWNDDFWRWDASVKYRITDLLSVNVNLVNISGQPDRTFYGDTNYPTDRYYYGMTGSAGIQLNY
jgi:TonB-dependent receptor